MKKLFLATVCALGLSLTANAETFEKGYHGFADLGYTFGIGGNVDVPATEIMTSHGYQFNKYFFLGAGMGFQFSGKYEGETIGDNHPYDKRDSKVDVPVFFNARLNFLKTKCTPFLDAKFGTYVNNGSGSYINASLGCRFSIKNNQGIYVMVGYVTRKFEFQYVDFYIEGKYNPHIVYNYDKTDIQEADGITIKVGYDF